MKTLMLSLLSVLFVPVTFADSVAYSSGDSRLGTERPTATACMDLNQHFKEKAEAEKREKTLAERCASDSSGRQTAIKFITSLGQPLPKALVEYAPVQVAEIKVKQPRPVDDDISEIVRSSQQNWGPGGGRQIHRKPGAQ